MTATTTNLFGWDQPMQPPAQCPGGCSHTDREHIAFDAGLAAGEEDPNAENPHAFSAYNLYEAWASGFSVGRINARKKKEEMK